MAETTTSTLARLQKKEQAGRTIITLALLGTITSLGVYFWGIIVPFLIDAATNTLKLAGLCTVLAGLTYCVLDKRLRTIGLYAYVSGVRYLIKQFTAIDTIGVLNTHISRLEDRLNEMDKSIGVLHGQCDGLGQTIAGNEENRIRQDKLARQAHKRAEGGDAEMKQEFALRARQAGRLEKSNMTLQKLFDRMSALLKAMVKMRDVAALLMEDMKSEVEVKTVEHKALLAGYSAFAKAQAIMAGGGPEREMFDMAMERLNDDYANKMGEIETFLDMSKSVINGVDLDQGIYEEDALARLKAWEEKGSKILDTSNTKARFEIPPPARVESSSAPDFDDLFSSSSDNDSTKHQTRR